MTCQFFFRRRREKTKRGKEINSSLNVEYPAPIVDRMSMRQRAELKKSANESNVGASIVKNRVSRSNLSRTESRAVASAFGIHRSHVCATPQSRQVKRRDLSIIVRATALTCVIRLAFCNLDNAFSFYAPTCHYRRLQDNATAIRGIGMYYNGITLSSISEINV